MQPTGHPAGGGVKRWTEPTREGSTANRFTGDGPSNTHPDDDSKPDGDGSHNPTKSHFVRLVPSPSKMDDIPAPSAKPLPSLPPKPPNFFNRISSKLQLRSNSTNFLPTLTPMPPHSKSSSSPVHTNSFVSRESRDAALRERGLIPPVRQRTQEAEGNQSDEGIYSTANREAALRERGLVPPMEVEEKREDKDEGEMTEARRIKEEWRKKMKESDNHADG